MAASLVVTASERLEVKVFGAMAGTEAETSAELARLCDAAAAPPRAAVHHPGTFREVKRFLAGAGDEAEEADAPMWCKSEYFAAPLPDTAAEALVAHLAARPDGVIAELDFSPWAGAYARVAPDATAFAHRDARFLLKHAVAVQDGAGAEPARAWLAASHAIAHPHGTGGAYPNFPDSDLDPWDPGYHLANRGACSRSSAATTRTGRSALRRDRARLQDEDLVVLDRPLDVLRPAEPLLELDPHRGQPRELACGDARRSALLRRDSTSTVPPDARRRSCRAAGRASRA